MERIGSGIVDGVFYSLFRDGGVIEAELIVEE
jgi:hypothetical protein